MDGQGRVERSTNSVENGEEAGRDGGKADTTPSGAVESRPEAAAGGAVDSLPEGLLALPLPTFLAECEARYLAMVLEAAGGNQRAAAERAGVPVDTFHKKMKRHGLQVEVVRVRITRDGGRK